MSDANTDLPVICPVTLLHPPCLHMGKGPQAALRGRCEVPQGPGKLALTSCQPSGSSIRISGSLLEIDFPLSPMHSTALGWSPGC